MHSVKVVVSKRSKDPGLHLCPGQNLYTGVKNFERHFKSLNSLEEDLLNLASGIYAADLACKRLDREQNIRTIDFYIDVINYHIFERIKDKLIYALMLISRDNWNIVFRPIKGKTINKIEWVKDKGIVLLFSGGMDSMCAASKFLNNNQELVLVSHNSQRNRIVDNCQNEVHTALENYYCKKVNHIHIKVYGRKNGKYEFPEDRENTQRTRSFLFLTIAALVTRRKGFERIVYMAENGQFAIHLPLNQARIGPFSTHTADPEFIIKIEEIFKIILNNECLEISNPFLYLTKAEVFGLLPEKLKSEVGKSASCWKISRTPGNKHCGFCIPCISRRIALEYHNIKINEYARDLFNEDILKKPSDDDGKRNLIDYLEFISNFANVNNTNKNKIMIEYPELFNQYLNTDKAIELYKRVSKQSFEVFQKYKNIKNII